MAGFIRSNVKRVKTSALSTSINKEVFDDFRDYCKELGYPMNVMIETFMRQYGKGTFDISEEDIFKFKDENEDGNLSTTISAEVYLNFKETCQFNGYPVRHVLSAFMEKFTSRNYVLEYVNTSVIKEVTDEK